MKSEPGRLQPVRAEFPVSKHLNQLVMVNKLDITALQMDAIVNAAKPSLLGGKGVDGAIHEAAGRGLFEECAQLNGCGVGEAKITSGHKLPARHVIHTVGPVGEDEPALRKSYESCLQLCLEHGIRSVAFPCISTGHYGYPEEAAAKVALHTVRKWLEDHGDHFSCIMFCTYSDRALELYKTLMPQYFPVEKQGVPDNLNDRGLGPMANTRSTHQKAS